jgi:hypothetical protein
MRRTGAGSSALKTPPVRAVRARFPIPNSIIGTFDQNSEIEISYVLSDQAVADPWNPNATLVKPSFSSYGLFDLSVTHNVNYTKYLHGK